MKHTIPAGRMDPCGTAAASGRFRRFKPEAEQKTREWKVERNDVFEAIIDTWMRYRMGELPVERRYKEALGCVGGMQLLAQDIDLFSIALSQFQDEPFFTSKAGIFLSALIEASPELDFVIRLAHLDAAIDNLGFMNRKRVVVIGGVGHFCGEGMRAGLISVEKSCGICPGKRMEGGTIIIEGNADSRVGLYMKGGNIRVKGNVGEGLGLAMAGGEIIVGGNAEDTVGNGMTGGEIRINGHFELGCINMAGGKIFHKGELIFPK